MGERREAVGAIVSLVCVAATAYLPFAWWGRVKADARLNDLYDCADLFHAGFSPETKPVSCLNKAGNPSVVVSNQYPCEDGSVLFANDFGWWSAADNRLRVPSDRGKPPRAELDRCVSR